MRAARAERSWKSATTTGVGAREREIPTENARSVDKFDEVKMAASCFAVVFQFPADSSTFFFRRANKV